MAGAEGAEAAYVIHSALLENGSQLPRHGPYGGVGLTLQKPREEYFMRGWTAKGVSRVNNKNSFRMNSPLPEAGCPFPHGVARVRPYGQMSGESLD